MIAALTHHTRLLLTFRHDLRGLEPRSMHLLALVSAAAFAVAFVAHWLHGCGGGIMPGGAVVLSMLMATALGFKRAAIAAGLISIGVDIAILPFMLIAANSELVSITSSAWEAAAFAVCCVKGALR